jgi:hypothetical protein
VSLFPLFPLSQSCSDRIYIDSPTHLFVDLQHQQPISRNSLYTFCSAPILL